MTDVMKTFFVLKDDFIVLRNKRILVKYELKEYTVRVWIKFYICVVCDYIELTHLGLSVLGLRQVSKFIGQNIHSLLPYKHRKTTICGIWREKEIYIEQRRTEQKCYLWRPVHTYIVIQTMQRNYIHVTYNITIYTWHTI